MQIQLVLKVCLVTLSISFLQCFLTAEFLGYSAAYRGLSASKGTSLVLSKLPPSDYLLISKYLKSKLSMHC